MNDIADWKTTSRCIGVLRALAAVLLAAVAGSADTQQQTRAAEQPAFSLPDDIAVRHATIWSEGTRMAANIYSPKAASGKLPTIIMAYGWGGTMERVREEGAAFA